MSRKSWVTAIPMEAKASEVRNQARKVRSTEYQHWHSAEAAVQPRIANESITWNVELGHV